MFRIACTQETAEYIIRYCSIYGNFEVYQDNITFRIVEEDDVALFKRILNYLIESFKASGVIVKYVEEIEDRRKKIPQAKLFIHFWAGSAEKDNIYLNYKGNADLERVMNK